MSPKNRVSTDEKPEPKLKLWISTDHDKHELEAKVASYVLAYDLDQARKLLDEALISAGLRPYRMWRYQLQEIPMTRPQAEVLNDGDY